MHGPYNIKFGIFGVLIAVQFWNHTCGFMFCHMIHYFVKKFTSVSAHFDTSEDTKGLSFLLLWSEILIRVSFPNLLLECLDMTHAQFLLLMPFDE
jgi:hypothetical protein